MATAAPQSRCGIDSVELARVERLLSETAPEDLSKLYWPQELADSGDGPGRVASLAARFAAKEACLKLFPREAALGTLGLADFAVARDAYGAPQVLCSAAATDVLARNRLQPIAVSLTHDRTSASAVAMTGPASIDVPLAGRLMFHLFPLRRKVVLSNLRLVFGDTLPEAEIRRLAQAHYAHLWRLFGEFLRFPWLSAAQRTAMVRVENIEAMHTAAAQGKGILLLTGHLGNWEVATVAGIGNFPQYRDRFHFVRRVLKPRWVDNLVTRRFRRAGFGILPKRGALDAILDRLAEGDVIVFAFDQHAGGSDGIRVEFFGHSAGTFRSLALIALATGAPVVPAASWRERDGTHVLRFEDALPAIHRDEVDEEIRRNTRLYNATLERLILRHPEQWYWVHRRWKGAGTAQSKSFG
jgi:phosphopantetheine--protein transferase-like protein